MELSLLVDRNASSARGLSSRDLAGFTADDESLWCCSVLSLMRHNSTNNLAGATKTSSSLSSSKQASLNEQASSPNHTQDRESSPSHHKNPLRAIYEMRSYIDDSEGENALMDCDAFIFLPVAKSKNEMFTSASATPTQKSELLIKHRPIESRPPRAMGTLSSTLLSACRENDKSIGGTEAVEATTPPTKGDLHNNLNTTTASCLLNFQNQVRNHRRRKQPSSDTSSTGDAAPYKRRRFACGFPGCGKTFGQTNHLQAHRRLHTGERPFVCTHEGCNKAFTQTGHLTAHLRIHTGERPYACSFPGCHKRFTQSTNMRMHMRVHGGFENSDDHTEGLVACRFQGCTRTFASRRGMETHVRSVHLAMLKSSQLYRAQEDDSASCSSGHHDDHY